MNKYFLILTILISSTSMAKTPKADAEVNSYLPLDQQSLEIFNEISTKTWSIKYNVEAAIKSYKGDEIIIKKFPFNYEKFFNFSLVKTKESRLFGLLNKSQYAFGMIGGTWVGVDTPYASHGGGYANPIPVKKMGHKKINENSTQFMIWAREDYYVDSKARRMHTDVLNPLLATVSDTIELDALLRKDPICQEIITSNPYAGTLDDCTYTDTVFDYLVLEYSQINPTQLKVTGRNLNEAEDVFTFKMNITKEKH